MLFDDSQYDFCIAGSTATLDRCKSTARYLSHNDITHADQHQGFVQFTLVSFVHFESSRLVDRPIVSRILLQSVSHIGDSKPSILTKGLPLHFLHNVCTVHCVRY
jgi:hypothetical protein